MRNLEPIYTVHASNPMGDLYGYVYERHNGAGYISMLEIKVKEGGFITVYHPELPRTHLLRTEACESIADAVMDFDWELDHPWLSAHARSNAITLDNPDGFDEIVEDMVNNSGFIPLPEVTYFDVECMHI